MTASQSTANNGLGSGRGPLQALSQHDLAKTTTNIRTVAIQTKILTRTLPASHTRSAELQHRAVW